MDYQAKVSTANDVSTQSHLSLGKWYMVMAGYIGFWWEYTIYCIDDLLSFMLF